MLAPNKQSSLIAMEEGRTLNCAEIVRTPFTHFVYAFQSFAYHTSTPLSPCTYANRVAVCSNHTRKQFAVYNVDVLRQCTLTHDTMDL